MRATKSSHALGCQGKKKGEERKRKERERKKEGRKLEKKIFLFFRSCDLQFILTISLLNNKNKM
jgi:hypothetical protein